MSVMYSNGRKTSKFIKTEIQNAYLQYVEPVYNSEKYGETSYTVLEKGLYLIIVSVSYQGNKSITLPQGRTPIVNENVVVNTSIGVQCVAVNLFEGDIVTLNAQNSNWAAFSKQIYKLKGITIQSVYGTDAVQDNTLSFSVPDNDNEYMVIGTCFGGESHKFTVNTDGTPAIKTFVGGTETYTVIMADKGHFVPDLEMYGYDGGGVFFVGLNITIERENLLDNIHKIVNLTYTDWNALVTKDKYTLYNVFTDRESTIIWKTFLGDKRILCYKDENDLSDYEFWYENLWFGYTNGASSYARYQSIINTGIKIRSAANINRDWQLEFNCEPTHTNKSGGSESPIIGSYGSSSPNYYELYTKHSDTNDNLYPYGCIGNDSSLGSITNKDVIIRKVNNVITYIVDGVEVRTYNWNSSSTTESDDYQMVIGYYRQSHFFEGNMKYIGFKWLSSGE